LWLFGFNLVLTNSQIKQKKNIKTYKQTKTPKKSMGRGKQTNRIQTKTPGSGSIEFQS
jgi:hypothetical protein